MTQGTLYASSSPRSISSKALIKYFNLDYKIITNLEEDATFGEKFPIKKVPSLWGPKGLKLNEAMAILFYLANSIDDEKIKSKLIGSTVMEKTEIIRWLSFSNMDVSLTIFKIFLTFLGATPYNKKEVDNAYVNLDKYASFYEQRLKNFTYLATESISLADLHAASFWSLAFSKLVGPQFVAKFPALVRWFKTVISSPIMAPFFIDFEFTDKPMEYVPPKKEKKPKAEQNKTKVEKKPETTAGEESAQPAKKPKHPLEALGKSTFILDEWKRQYSNEDTRPVALPWFWKHYNPEEYSLWKVDYKYNDELTLTFMSNNLIGGFFNRLSASNKYMFGCLVVYGENNNNGITGAIMVRGQDHIPAFDVAPDWESYSYTKLDPTKQEDKEFVDNMWAWDKPVIVNGESKEIVDGKVLK
ncbi:elongation factor 1-gamma NDAI_0G05860 [Naumovozyma dairenensis CBS 421]|uniref:Elongation factor 1-gamma 1 n=1 Tax=Naumovozyma dairenensis (strain ATCC 10597 / BCRC 20456 / CBS 421 / NBRC 0211 / NRRL Y-12639) TaxID=1071378 RepID=J7REM6_NAUDC|nr:hypothetical protein NDAI_0G05860 [Naumovozyma dairenensis CBS 421]CCK73569.1 hypothetical protein NDAI_0G05860 [Naumovozyma dairenensis CBS 421]